MTVTANNMLLWIYGLMTSLKNRTIESFEQKLVKCDAWFLVLLAVLMGLAFVIASALAIWCIVYQGKRFTGEWKWNQWGVSVYVECV